MKVYIRALFGLLMLVSQQAAAQTKVTFEAKDIPASSTDIIGIRGSLPPLSWDNTLSMQKKGDGYAINVSFPSSGQELEFKFVYQESASSEVNWETIDNRTLTLTDANTEYMGIWDEPFYRDPATLPLLSVEDLQADIELIETIFREVHPGTFRYLTEEQLDANLNTLRTAFFSPSSLGKVFLAINEFTASIQCGHTASPLYNQNSDVTAMLFYGPDKLPFSFQWRDERMIVKLDATAGKILPLGTEVISINGYSAQSILETMRKYVPSDGPAVGPKDGFLSLRAFPWRYELFDAAFHLLYPPTAEGYLIEFKTPGQEGKIKEYVKPLTRRERTEIIAQRYPNHPQKAADLWHLDLSNDKVAVLTLGEFAVFGKGGIDFDYSDFFADAFFQINASGVEKLIIDIRENQGGNDPVVAELLSYILHRPQKETYFEGAMRYRSFPEQLRPYVKTWGSSIPEFFDPKPGKPSEEGEYYIYPKAFKPERGMKIKKGAFWGEVVFLTGRVNASLGFYLAHYVRHNEVGTLIGETTGGCQCGLNGGNLALLRLPNTDLELDFPIMGGFALDEVPAIGIVPDIEVVPTVQDEATGNDPVMEAALKYLLSED
ncbi:MAG: S41 family peptidase [Bacteroidota bacterium]